MLSHWHLDHVAGHRGVRRLRSDRQRAHGRAARGPPGRDRGRRSSRARRAIDPLVLPTRTFAGRERLEVGAAAVELIQADIHSDDATVLWLPDQRLLFAGDTMEDTVTYVDRARAASTRTSRTSTARASSAPQRILPNHGDPDVIAAGGYSDGLIRATQQYIARCSRAAPTSPRSRATPLRELVAGPLEAGWIT